jgi:hypothetical protein
MAYMRMLYACWAIAYMHSAKKPAPNRDEPYPSMAHAAGFSAPPALPASLAFFLAALESGSLSSVSSLDTGFDGGICAQPLTWPHRFGVSAFAAILLTRPLEIQSHPKCPHRQIHHLE